MPPVPPSGSGVAGVGWVSGALALVGAGAGLGEVRRRGREGAAIGARIRRVCELRASPFDRGRYVIRPTPAWTGGRRGVGRASGTVGVPCRARLTEHGRDDVGTTRHP